MQERAATVPPFNINGGNAARGGQANSLKRSGGGSGGGSEDPGESDGEGFEPTVSKRH